MHGSILTPWKFIDFQIGACFWSIFDSLTAKIGFLPRNIENSNNKMSQGRLCGDMQEAIGTLYSIFGGPTHIQMY